MNLACVSALTAAIAFAPGDARAATYSGAGWVQLQKSSSNSVSTTIEGKDFGVGYTAYFELEGYNWDVAPDTITQTCVMYLVKKTIWGIPFVYPVIESVCATLPGTQLSSSTTSASTTYNGYPATKQTTTVVWDVQDSGALGQADGYFEVPVTLFSEDLDLFKLTASAAGKTYGDDTVSAGVYVLGAKIAGASATLPASKRVVQKCVTLAEADVEYSIIGIPVSVGASADGCIYVDASASFDGTSKALSGTVTPGASVDATVTAGVGADAGVVSAEAGVYGSITVVDASLPLTISAAAGSSGVTVTESARLTMTGLDGEVGLYAEACFLFYCDDSTLTLFDWTGMTYASSTLFSASQTVAY